VLTSTTFFASGKARDQIVELEHEPDAFASVGGEARLVARGQVVIEVVRGAGCRRVSPPSISAAWLTAPRESEQDDVLCGQVQGDVAQRMHLLSPTR
jgi:hypothetical protein